jgi:hypothetical protein
MSMGLSRDAARGDDETALAFSGLPDAAATSEEQPGFSLADDADGRFVIDRETGIISVFNEALVAREPHAVHAARIRVVERDGGAYEFAIRLKITGPVPQVVGEYSFDAAPAGAEPAPPAPAAEPAPKITETARRFSARAWALYAAAFAKPGELREAAPPQILLAPLLPEHAPPTELALESNATAAFVAWSAA